MVVGGVNALKDLWGALKDKVSTSIVQSCPVINQPSLSSNSFGAYVELAF